MVFYEVQTAACGGAQAMSQMSVCQTQVDELRRELLWMKRTQEDEKLEWLRLKDGLELQMERQAEEISQKDTTIQQQKEEIARLYTVIEQLTDTDNGKLKLECDRQMEVLKSECRRRMRQTKADAAKSMAELQDQIQQLQATNQELQKALQVQRELNETANSLQEECNQLVQKVVELTEDNWKQAETIQSMEEEIEELHNERQKDMTCKGSAEALQQCRQSPRKDASSVNSEKLPKRQWTRTKSNHSTYDDVQRTMQTLLGGTLKQNISLQRDVQALTDEVSRLMSENERLRVPPAANTTSEA